MIEVSYEISVVMKFVYVESVDLKVRLPLNKIIEAVALKVRRTFDSVLRKYSTGIFAILPLWPGDRLR